jgi:Cft2 family RNA processing exonuclease
VPTLTAISGLGGKGPACFLLETAHARLLLDLGYGPQPGVLPNIDRIGKVDALLLSHSHRDHAGGFSLLPKAGNPPVYATDIVRRRLPAHLATHALPLQGQNEVQGLRITTGRSGHAPGGIWLHIAIGGGVLYMGDNCAESLIYAADAPPAAEIIIADCSYGAYDTPLSAVTVEFDRVFDAGPVLLPIPAAGRGPEIALHLLRSGRALPHIDAAMRASLTHLATQDSACLQPAAQADLARLATEAPDIDGIQGVILAGVADATSGDAARLVQQWEHQATPTIVFTGYLPPGTPAQRLTNAGRARYLRWNVHPLLADNARLLRAVGAKTVLPAFGDAAKALPDWQRAFAPARVVVEGAVEF